ncbi:hypothetical protein RsoM2USA_182 [Ralstonia phage RsoM2USA]|nr:hypothetical protein RsoM2USA_182 [Ralstonia phage RsoM2USA]
MRNRQKFGITVEGTCTLPLPITNKICELLQMFIVIDVKRQLGFQNITHRSLLTIVTISFYTKNRDVYNHITNRGASPWKRTPAGFTMEFKRGRDFVFTIRLSNLASAGGLCFSGIFIRVSSSSVIILVKRVTKVPCLKNSG